MNFSNDILKAVITTAVSVILGFFLKELLDKLEFKTISSSRRKALKGKWKGRLNQITTNQITEIEFNFNVGLFGLKGNGFVYRNESSSIGKYLLKGGFRNERFLELRFKNQRNEVINFGFMILELSPDAKILKGVTLAYGHESGAFVNGTIELSKI